MRAQAKAHSYRFRGGLVRVTPWHGRADVAAISLSGTAAPAPTAVERILDHLRADGFREVTTNALAPATCLPLLDAGFVVTGRLHLLVHDLGEVPSCVASIRRAARADFDAILAIDRASFDDEWALDDVGLREAIGATPRARMLVAPAQDDARGFGLFGRAGTNGYVQLLAVAPDHRGAGTGRGLLTTGLRWLRDHGAARAYVNTQEGNERALDLYTRAGFVQSPVGLCVLGCTL